MFCVDLVSFFIALFVIIVVYFKWNYQYWKRKNLPYVEPTFPFGTTGNPFRHKEYVGVKIKHHYDYFRSRGCKHGGLYCMLTPTYLVVDSEYLKNILTKDFHHFTDRGIYYNEKDDPLSAHLFAIGGEKWRDIRTKLTPTFTSGKMRIMFQTLLDCVPNFLKKIETDCLNKIPIDVKEVFGCFTTDVIGSCAFGLDFNTLKEKHSPFRKYSRKFLPDTRFRMVLFILTSAFPTVARTLGVVLTPKDVSEFFIKLVKDTIQYREKNKVSKKDFIQMLINMKNNKRDGKSLTTDEIAAQSFVFFIAGFETSSTTMTFALYELSKKPDWQQKVRNEINTVLAKYDGKITYSAIQELKYMDQVINETLRMYPPIPFLNRQCVKDYKIPDENIVIEKGTNVVIPVFGIHHNEKYYPDPEKFDPERFTDENKAKRHNYSYLPFGEGPRNCIGMRFGLMQTKVGLTTLLANYKFSVNNKTLEPLVMKSSSFVPSAEGGVWLSAEKI